LFSDMPQVEEIEDEVSAVNLSDEADVSKPQEASAPEDMPQEPEECKPPTWLDPAAASNAAPETSPAAKSGEKKAEDDKVPLTAEELKEQEEQLEIARSLKAIGNQLFGEHDYESALQKYTAAIEAAPQGHKEQAVFYNNRATCHFKLGNQQDVISDCSAALKIDPDYSKCSLRRAQAYETEKKVCEAFDDFQRVLKLDPSNRIAQDGSKRLEKPAAEEREKLKEEMMGKLKDLGNSILGNFGMSLDNFKAVQDPATGSYSISFQQ